MTATDTEKTAKKRGDGPIAISFLDAEGKEHKRVPKGVKHIHVKPKSGDPIKFDLSQLSPDTVMAYAAMGLAGRKKTYVLNHMNTKGDGSDAIPLVNEIWTDALAGNIYAKSEAAEKKPGTG